MLTALFTSLFVSLASALPVEITANPTGGFVFNGGKLEIDGFEKGWKALSVSNTSSSEDGLEHNFEVKSKGVVYFTGKSVWKQRKEGGPVQGTIKLKCQNEIELYNLSPMLRMPLSPVAGKKWKAGEDGGTLPAEMGEKSGLGHGEARKFTVPLPDGKLSISLPEEVSYSAADGRKYGDYWTLRLGEGKKYCRPGEEITFTMTVNAPGGVILKPYEIFKVHSGQDWIPLHYYKDIVPGSALDFSPMGLQDAPAGKYGWLKAGDGSFYFEDRPGVPVRFYGVNICYSANYPSHELADSLICRLMRLGYNSIRIHHHDDSWRNPDKQDRLDYLIAAAINKGIYITTDLYVSRKVTWRDIGIDKDGAPSIQLFKALVGCYPPAFDNWKEFAREFLLHVNPYTGRAYVDEPGMPLISLVNEGGLSMGWDHKTSDERLIDYWHAHGGSGALPAKNSEAFRRLAEAFDRDSFTKCSEAVRDLGCKALLTNDNSGEWHGDGEGATPMYDYVDNHFYIDHPYFPQSSWKLPSMCNNTNPIINGPVKLFTKGYATNSHKPYTITEWNHAAPGKYRAMSGLITGFTASRQGWDGVWRFDYASNISSLDWVIGTLNYFDLSRDPIGQASDRAALAIFLRGEGDPARGGRLSLDKDSKSLSLSTPLSCGVFSPGGKVSAGIMEADISDAAATLWLTSVDGATLAESGRLLLSHMTDVLDDGMEFMDGSRGMLTSWGRSLCIGRGSAVVSLSVTSPSEYKVYALDTSGKRTEQIDTSVSGGRLTFTLCTKGYEGGRIYYEIVK